MPRWKSVGAILATITHRVNLAWIDEAYLDLTETERTGGSVVEVGQRSARWSRPGERGVGCQETFAVDLDYQAAMRAEILRVSDKVTTRMRAVGVLGRTVTLSLRFADFATCPSSSALAAPTDLTGEVYAAAWRRYPRLVVRRPALPRVGVRVTGLIDRSRVWHQPMLDDSELGWEAVEAAADKVNRVFGPQSVQRAVLTGRKPGVSI